MSKPIKSIGKKVKPKLRKKGIKKTKGALERIKAIARKPINAWKNRGIKKRSISYNKLPPKIKKNIDKVRRARWGAVRNHLPEAAGAACLVAGAASKTPTLMRKSPAIVLGLKLSALPAAKRKPLEQYYSRLQRAIIKSKNPRIIELREKHPYFIVNRVGKLVFTSRERFLNAFGRKRGKTINKHKK